MSTPVNPGASPPPSRASRTPRHVTARGAAQVHCGQPPASCSDCHHPQICNTVGESMSTGHTAISPCVIFSNIFTSRADNHLKITHGGIRFRRRRPEDVRSRGSDRTAKPQPAEASRTGRCERQAGCDALRSKHRTPGLRSRIPRRSKTARRRSPPVSPSFSQSFADSPPARCGGRLAPPEPSVRGGLRLCE